MRLHECSACTAGVNQASDFCHPFFSFLTSREVLDSSMLLNFLMTLRMANSRIPKCVCVYVQ